jgi:hypothetical protein
MAIVVIRSTGKTSDEITKKDGNETRQVRTHTWAPGTPPQYLSIRVIPKVTEEVVHHASLLVDGGLHLRLHVCKVIHLSFKSSDPFHRTLSCHTPFRERGNEASIRVPRMFKSHAWQQYDKQMQCY